MLRLIKQRNIVYIVMMKTYILMKIPRLLIVVSFLIKKKIPPLQIISIKKKEIVM